MKQLQTGLQQTKTEVKYHTKPQSRYDKFGERIKEFLGTAESRVNKLQEQHALMEKKFDELAKFYCFDRKKVSMDEFFGDMNSFCKDFEVSGREGVR